MTFIMLRWSVVRIEMEHPETWWMVNIRALSGVLWDVRDISDRMNWLFTTVTRSTKCWWTGKGLRQGLYIERKVTYRLNLERSLLYWPLFVWIHSKGSVEGDQEEKLEIER